MRSILLPIMAILSAFNSMTYALEEGRKAAPSTAAKDKAVYGIVTEFMFDVRKGNVAKAYQTLTSSDFRGNTTLNHLISFISQYPSLRRNRTVELINIHYYENVARLDVTLSSLEHEDNIAQFFLRYEQGQWRIISIKIIPSF